MTPHVATGTPIATSHALAEAPAYSVTALDPAGILLEATTGAAPLPDLAVLRRLVDEARIVVVRGAAVPRPDDLAAVLAPLGEPRDGAEGPGAARAFDSPAEPPGPPAQPTPI